MKQKTHSGAKKRFRAKPGGKIKRGQTKMRHLMNSKNHKAKRHLGGPAYVSTANEYQIIRCLVS